MRLLDRLNGFSKVGLFILISCLISFLLHTHLDEFILFRDLEYQNPNFYLNKFASGYNEVIKIFPFNIKIPLPYLYTGNLQGILFYPFYKLFSIELAKSIYSFFSLTVIYLLINKCFELNNIKKWILVFFLPFYVTVLHDSGPVNIGIISFFVSKILVEKIFNFQSNKELIYASVSLIFCWTIAFYDKQFYLFLFPSVLLFSIANVDYKKLLSLRLLLLIFPLIGFVGFVLLYMLGNTQIIPYNNDINIPIIVQTKNAIGGTNDLSVLFHFILKFPESIAEWRKLDGFFADRLFVFAMWINSFDFSFYLIRNLNLAEFYWPTLGSSFTISSYLFILFLVIHLFTFIWGLFKQGISNHGIKPFIYFLSFLCLSVCFFVLGKVRSPHHFIYLWVPLIGFIFDNKFQLYRSKSFLAFFFTTLSICIFNFFNSGPSLPIIDSYQSIVPYTQRDNKNLLIINFDSWSHVITRKLDNPNHHIVTWVDPRNTTQILRLTKLADSLKLPIIEVSNRIDWGNDAKGVAFKPMSPDEKMKIFLKLGYKVKKINKSTNIPIYYISR